MVLAITVFLLSHWYEVIETSTFTGVATSASARLLGLLVITALCVVFSLLCISRFLGLLFIFLFGAFLFGVRVRVRSLLFDAVIVFLELLWSELLQVLRVLLDSVELSLLL